MAKTFTPRFTLPQWSSGDDAVSRVDFTNAMASLEQNAAMDAQGLMANRPAYGKRGRYYWATDTGKMYRDSGTSWDLLNPTPEWGNIANKPSTFAPSYHSHAGSDINPGGALTIERGIFTGFGDTAPTLIASAKLNQSANVFEVRNSDGSTMAYINKDGRFVGTRFVLPGGGDVLTVGEWTPIPTSGTSRFTGASGWSFSAANSYYRTIVENGKRSIEIYLEATLVADATPSASGDITAAKDIVSAFGPDFLPKRATGLAGASPRLANAGVYPGNGTTTATKFSVAFTGTGNIAAGYVARVTGRYPID